MKKIILAIVVCLLSVVIVLPTASSASTVEWAGPVKVVQSNKVWTVVLTKMIQPSSVHSNSVYVLDENGQKVNVSVSISPTNPKALIVKPPNGGYTKEKLYTLFIDKSITSKDQNTSMKNSTKMTFLVSDLNYPQLVQGKWNSYYNGYPIQVTFKPDFSLVGTIMDMTVTGFYSMNGSKMTVQALGYTVSGTITKVSDHEFIITSASGNVMRFTK